MCEGCCSTECLYLSRVYGKDCIRVFDGCNLYYYAGVDNNCCGIYGFDFKIKICNKEKKETYCYY
jgi:hypothetical protein